MEDSPKSPEQKLVIPVPEMNVTPTIWINRWEGRQKLAGRRGGWKVEGYRVPYRGIEEVGNWEE
jgi:hypothetical protein